MATRKKVTKPKQAASASSLDRYLVELDEIYMEFIAIESLIADLMDSMERAEER